MCTRNLHALRTHKRRQLLLLDVVTTTSVLSPYHLLITDCQLFTRLVDSCICIVHFWKGKRKKNKYENAAMRAYSWIYRFSFIFILLFCLLSLIIIINKNYYYTNNSNNCGQIILKRNLINKGKKTKCLIQIIAIRFVFSFFLNFKQFLLKEKKYWRKKCPGIIV